MSVSHERPHSHEDPLSGVVELLSQEKIRKHLKAALGIIEWDKTALQREGKNFDTVGTFISPSAKLYEIARIDGSDRYSVWQYGLTALNEAGRPIAPTMAEYRSEPGTGDGITRLSHPDDTHDITLDAFDPHVISVEGATAQAHEASQMLQQHGFATARR